jgi:UPF0716 family protein affecting phage T7 exclusion
MIDFLPYPLAWLFRVVGGLLLYLAVVVALACIGDALDRRQGRRAGR